MKKEDDADDRKKDEELIIPQMFECEGCGNIYKDKWETCPACGSKIRDKEIGTIEIKTDNMEIKTDNSDDEPQIPIPQSDSRFTQKMPSIDDIFGNSRIPLTPPPDDKTIHDTKVRQAPLDSVFSFEEIKPKVRIVKKVKKVKQPSVSFCPYCGKNLPKPTSGDWTFCLYCGMKLK